MANKLEEVLGAAAAIAKGMTVTFKEMVSPDITENYPDEPPKFEERFRGTHVLQRDENGLEKCVACFLCAAACPAQCIYIEAAENTDQVRISGGERYAKTYNIDYNRCIFCGYCVEACPTDAITHGHGFELASYNTSTLIYRKEDLLAAVPAGAKPVVVEPTVPAGHRDLAPPLRLFLAGLLTAIGMYAADGDLQTANIGDLQLENGATVRDCVVAYRAFGKLNADRSNAVLFPTWFTGRTGNLIGSVGPGHLVDPSKFYVILVDAIGDGVSSSPSTSKQQPGIQFPVFTIRDMVESQHKLLTQNLGIPHLFAVIGISMGGMQAFQWITAYPEFMDRAIPIVGSPKLSSIDLLLWTAEKHTIEAGADWNGGRYKNPPEKTMAAVSDIHQFAVATPEHRNSTLPAADFAKFAADTEANTLKDFDANDWLRQLQAMLAQDVSKPFDGSMERAAQAVKARVLIVVSAHDHMVNPQAATDFAKLLKVQPVVLSGPCGRLATGCEAEKVTKAVAEFLQ